MASSNVIELVFKMRDGVSKPLNALKGNIGGFLKLGAGAAGVLGIVATFQKVISASREAQDTLASFDLAFKNLGQTVGKTREDMIRFADEASKRTIFDDEAILRSQAVLLKFKSVTGETFGRARQAALDLASVMKIDLESAANIVGRAIERPSIALRQLRQVGVIFSADQEKVIKQLEKTGQQAKAAGIIMTELEKKIKGGAATAAGTLSGALARAKTAFDNLFEVDVDKLAGSVGKLADTLNDPKIRESIQLMVSGFVKLLDLAVKIAAKTSEWTSDVLDASANFQANNSGGQASLDFRAPDARNQFLDVQKEANEKVAALRKQIDEMLKRGEGEFYVKGLRKELASFEQQAKTATQALEILANSQLIRKRAGSNRRGGDRGSGTQVSQVAQDLEEITEAAVRAQRQLYSTKTAIDAFYEDLRESVLAQTDRAEIAFDRRVVALDELRAAGRISGEEYARAYQEALDEFLPEVQVTAKRATGRSITEIKDNWDKAAESISDSLANAISEGGFHGMTSFREIVQQTLRGVLADILKSGIKDALLAIFAAVKKAIGNMSGGGSGGGGIFGFLGSILGTSGIGGGVPLMAGGGRIPPQGAIVGERGPEYVRGGMVYNANTMRGLMSPPKLTFSPTNSVVIHGNADDQAQQAMFMYFERQNKKLAETMTRALERATGRRAT